MLVYVILLILGLVLYVAAIVYYLNKLDKRISVKNNNAFISITDIRDKMKVSEDALKEALKQIITLNTKVFLLENPYKFKRGETIYARRNVEYAFWKCIVIDMCVTRELRHKYKVFNTEDGRTYEFEKYSSFLITEAEYKKLLIKQKKGK